LNFTVVTNLEIVYCVVRSKTEVLCAEAGIAWLPNNEVRQTNQPKHIKPFLLRITYTIFSLNVHNKLFKKCSEIRNYFKVNDWID
jgi:hypothetical protein